MNKDQAMKGAITQEQCAVKRPHPAHKWNLPNSAKVMWCNGKKATR